MGRVNVIVNREVTIMSPAGTSTPSAPAVAPLIPDEHAVRAAIIENRLQARLLRQQLRICERRARDAEFLASLKRPAAAGHDAARAG